MLRDGEIEENISDEEWEFTHKLHSAPKVIERKTCSFHLPQKAVVLDQVQPKMWEYEDLNPITEDDEVLATASSRGSSRKKYIWDFD